MAGVVNPLRVSPSSIASPVRSTEALTQRTDKTFFFFRGWNSHSLEQWASAAGSEEVEGEAVSLRDSSINNERLIHKYKTVSDLEHKYKYYML